MGMALLIEYVRLIEGLRYLENMAARQSHSNLATLLWGYSSKRVVNVYKVTIQYNAIVYLPGVQISLLQLCLINNNCYYHHPLCNLSQIIHHNIILSPTILHRQYSLFLTHTPHIRIEISKFRLLYRLSFSHTNYPMDFSMILSG